MTLTLKQKILKNLGIKAFTPEGDEICWEKEITSDGSEKTEKVSVPLTGEEIFEAKYIRKRGIFNRWSLVYSWSGPNDMKYRLFNGRF